VQLTLSTTGREQSIELNPLFPIFCFYLICSFFTLVFEDWSCDCCHTTCRSSPM